MLPLKKDLDGKVVPIRNINQERVCTPEQLIFFLKNCFSPKERKFKIVFLVQLGCECRVAEACAVNLRDFHKSSNYRKFDMLIQKKVKNIRQKDGSLKTTGRNTIVTKIMPESIACFVRAWIFDNREWILESDGYIFPPNHMERKLPYTNPDKVSVWFSSKRKQLDRLFPDLGFKAVIGYRNYQRPNKLKGMTSCYLWSSHMFKRFAGTYGYLFTKDAVFMQELLCHEKLETTRQHYIDGAAVLRANDVERVKNKLFDYKFYEAIKGENEDVPAVWEEIKKA